MLYFMYMLLSPSPPAPQLGNFGDILCGWHCWHCRRGRNGRRNGTRNAPIGGSGRLREPMMGRMVVGGGGGGMMGVGMVGGGGGSSSSRSSSMMANGGESVAAEMEHLRGEKRPEEGQREPPIGRTNGRRKEALEVFTQSNNIIVWS